MIRIKCDYFNGAVAVPTELIDKHLKLAPAASFKVLLFILRNPDGTADSKQIGMCTGLNEADVCDCLDFWESNGVIEITEEKVSEEAFKTSLGNAKTVEPVEIKEEQQDKEEQRAKEAEQHFLSYLHIMQCICGDVRLRR